MPQSQVEEEDIWQAQVQNLFYNQVYVKSLTLLPFAQIQIMVIKSPTMFEKICDDKKPQICR